MDIRQVYWHTEDHHAMEEILSHIARYAADFDLLYGFVMTGVFLLL